jgi:eukaryotic-like serine/threonine-protein kinase
MVGSLAPGSVIEARYRLERLLGEGAFGKVYRAASLAPALADHRRRRVALKVLSGEQAAHPDAASRFTHEAYLGARLRHPNLVAVLDYGSLGDGTPYYAMELLRGSTLERVLADTPVLPPPLVARLVTDAAAGLAVLHRTGIVHRDVKPQNLFCETRRRRTKVRLLDLGVAGVYDGRRARRLRIVDVGAAGSLGTPAYLAPEQALGRAVDPRADVYALACVTYRMLTGTQVFAGGSVAETVHAHLFADLRPASRANPELPATVDAVLERALEKDRDARTPTVERFAAELGVALIRASRARSS